MEVAIRVDQIKVYAYIGVYHEEKILGGCFSVDVEVKVDLSEEELLTDELSATYNYEWIAEIVQNEMKVSCALLEKKAVEIAREILKTDTRLKNVKIKLSKLQPPLKGEVGSTSVEILI
ncbi:MAG TPA: dihydroneopterin aldolase [Chitinophagales bacterium]|nr:dihydroneopterin aldolase [Chitinophagales bacterium]